MPPPDQLSEKQVEDYVFYLRDEKKVKEAKTAAEKDERKKSDFLMYCDHAGLFADFHSHRHLFITNLERVGVSPRTAQTLARHCDIRLTMGMYTHIGLHDQSTAIEMLPAPPELAVGKVGAGNV
jgi:integrase